MSAVSFDVLHGQTVEQIWVWGPIRLVFDSNRPGVYVDFAEALISSKSDDAVHIDAQSSPADAGPVLRLLHDRVRLANADHGSLCLEFESGMRLRALPYQDFESWSVCALGRTTQCLPGGELEFWVS